ncbi:MAG TPA: hypothetical protein VN881_08795 [Candidatus Acidoferrales bacterium]|nr:hypothetical protein [Candidatus Acidoferrales bacterium]
MYRGPGWKFWKPSCVVLLLAGFAAPHRGNAQGFVNAVQSRARVFPEINSGVTAMKRDSSRRYYVLATPPNVVWIFSPEGKRIGQIPRAGAENAKIQYAVDFDLDSEGFLLVADRAANAVEIFSPDGSLLKSISVPAPTGVVALPENQFAVSTLRSKRLVEIYTDQGDLVRSFGDPVEAGADPSKQLQNLGRVFGDGNADIYFAFTDLPDPTVRKYDRFGYAATNVTLAANLYAPSVTPAPNDRVQFGINFSETSFSDSYNTWAAIGNKGDVFFGGGLSPGLGAHVGEGPATAQSATASILSTGQAAGPGGGGPGGTAGGGMVSAQGTFQADSLQFHLGGKPKRAGTADDSQNSQVPSGTSDAMLFTAPGSSSSDPFGSFNSSDSPDGLLSFSQPAGQGANAGTSGRGIMGGMGGFGGAGMFGGMGLGQGLFSGIGGFGQVGGASFGGGQGGSFGKNVEAFSAPSSATGAAGPRSFQRGPGDFHFGGGHGRYGEGLYNLTGTVKVNLDHLPSSSGDKAVITAVAVDRVSQDIWAAIGRVLVHFDRNGDYLGDYYMATPDGAPLRASAIIVEPDRLIVASESRGIYEFPRSDASVSHSVVTGSLGIQRPAQQSTSQ